MRFLEFFLHKSIVINLYNERVKTEINCESIEKSYIFTTFSRYQVSYQFTLVEKSVIIDIVKIMQINFLNLNQF